ncbi:MAG: VCBS repeat-containing protein [Bacteroidota bacterium]
MENESDNESVTLFHTLNKERTGISFENNIENTLELNILNYLYFYNGAGVAAVDVNNDGLIDLYFTANQTPDKLYINQGNFIFKDITTQAGIHNDENWTTGVTTVDINNDGLLDIYVCKIGNYNNIKGKNLLYINQGIKNGVPTFKEDAHSYGLDFSGFSTQAVFFDYDLDTDLDMFLLNHSVHPNSNYGNGNKRKQIDTRSGDKLFENNNGKFIDVSSEAGVFQGKIGYGLGVAVSDLNNDGYPDIYIGNDFFENDYLYINQKNKTFKEVISSDIKKLGHTTHFSMGNTIDDLNNDGKMDIVSLDMLPEDLYTYKTSGLEYPYQTYAYYLKNGYAPQYMQNTLHLNIDGENFSEIAFLSGIAATEWSWSPLAADFDNNGYKDLYITNGILGATNDMDFINFIADETIQRQLGKAMSQREMAFIEKLPQKKTINYFFKNNGDNTFQNNTKSWVSGIPSFSNGATYADLDNDGDLDIVVNNSNAPASILKNTSVEKAKKNNYLKLKFKGSTKNRFGIGVKIQAFTKTQQIVHENYTTKGYLSAVAPDIHIGLGNEDKIDSLHIIWPGGAFQTLKNVTANREITVTIEEARNNYYDKNTKNIAASFLNNVAPLFDVKHTDQSSVEFNIEPLIPYASTNLGPPISIADVNNDSLDDVFIGNSKTQQAYLFIQQKDGSFTTHQPQIFQEDAINEDTGSIFFDADNDTFKDLLIVSGGNEFTKGKPLQPRLYRNKNGYFSRDTIQFNNVEVNASDVTTIDINNDGAKDVCITANLTPRQFGKTPRQYIFENDGFGNFHDITDTFAPEFKQIGNVWDTIWIDLNNDTLKDAIVVGHWMPVSVFINDGKQLLLQKNNNLSATNGWWNTVEAHDFDNDGDIDIVAGNWGLNTRLNASQDNPITLYSNDFDDNGSTDPLITYFYQGMETPFASKDELVKQMPFLNKKYLSYKAFAKAPLNELFPSSKLKNASRKQVVELASCYFENLGNNTFKKHQLPFMAQISTVNTIAIDDFNADGFSDLLLAGNNYEISTQLGKLDASHGLVLLNDKNGFFTMAKDQAFNIAGPARNAKKIKHNSEEYYIITVNNDAPVFLRKNKE